MQHHTILAIDPGASGGLAWGLGTAASPATANMPADPNLLYGLLEDISLSSISPIHAFVEKVGGFIGKEQPASRAFTFGANYGAILGVLAAMEIPTTLVLPQIWQKSLSLGNSTAHAKGKWKSYLATCARRLYPKTKVTLANADAVLIFHAAATGRIKP